MVLVLSFALIPVVGVADQAIVGMLSVTLAVGILIGALVSGVSNALFPDPPTGFANRPGSTSVSREAARWIAMRATVIVMPVFVLAHTNPSFFVASIMQYVAFSKQAGEVDARSAGSELVGSTLMGALVAAVVWLGLSLHPSLWMLTLWMMGAALWTGSGIFRTRSTSFRPSFWVNALITMLILLGPAIEDSASGKSVVEASVGMHRAFRCRRALCMGNSLGTRTLA